MGILQVNLSSDAHHHGLLFVHNLQLNERLDVVKGAVHHKLGGQTARLILGHGTASAQGVAAVDNFRGQLQGQGNDIDEGHQAAGELFRRVLGGDLSGHLHGHSVVNEAQAVLVTALDREPVGLRTALIARGEFNFAKDNGGENCEDQNELEHLAVVYCNCWAMASPLL